MPKIYWFNSNYVHLNNAISNQLFDILKTSKRNWRKDVFLIDINELQKISDNRSDKIIYPICNYIHNQGCDIIVNLPIDNTDIHCDFKQKIGNKNLKEIYLFTRSNVNSELKKNSDFNLDATNHSINYLFNKMINWIVTFDKI